jgi:ABC-type uncharacterized transport system substrate-binding protein
MIPNRSISRSFAIVVALAAFLAAAPARAERLSAPLEAAIHLRALTYDRALKQRAGTSAVIALLYDPSSDASVQAANEIKDAFIALSKKMKVQDLPIVVKSVAYKDSWPSNELSKVAAVYVTPGLEGRLSDIRAQATKVKIPTLCGDRDLARQGLAIAVYVKGSSPGVTINLPSARAAGMDLDSRLLAIAEVLK